MGYRYQGGDGESKGIIIESGIEKRFSIFFLGLGLHGDVNNSIESEDGLKTSFKDTMGAYIYAEILSTEHLGLAIKYHFLDYKSEEGLEYKGSQPGVFVSLWF